MQKNLRRTSLVEEHRQLHLDSRCTLFYVNQIWTENPTLFDESVGHSFTVGCEIFSLWLRSYHFYKFSYIQLQSSNSSYFRFELGYVYQLNRDIPVNTLLIHTCRYMSYWYCHDPLLKLLASKASLEELVTVLIYA